jgi:hypothetical protein
MEAILMTTKDKLYARSTIRYGTEDGSVVTIEHGEVIKGLPDEVVDELIEAGAVATTPKVTTSSAPEEIAKRDDRIAELEAALAEARSGGGAPSSATKAPTNQSNPETKK